MSTENMDKTENTKELTLAPDWSFTDCGLVAVVVQWTFGASTVNKREKANTKKLTLAPVPRT